jgi:ABC-type transport system involved in Fe-S cluster assembly fused permease/ATPase subunit
MEFEQAHATFIQYHLERRSGERRGRLERGHQAAEKLFC